MDRCSAEFEFELCTGSGTLCPNRPFPPPFMKLRMSLPCIHRQCFTRLLFVVKPALQISQLKGRSPVCTRVWMTSSEAETNRLGQWLHRWGRMLLCRRFMWSSRLYLLRITAGHWGHLTGPDRLSGGRERVKFLICAFMAAEAACAAADTVEITVEGGVAVTWPLAPPIKV